MSLLNHVARIYESVLENGATAGTVANGVRCEQLGPWQQGFKSGKGATYMTCVLRQLIEMHCEYSTKTFIACLDVKKAFDRVPREKL